MPREGVFREFFDDGLVFICDSTFDGKYGKNGTMPRTKGDRKGPSDLTALGGLVDEYEFVAIEKHAARAGQTVLPGVREKGLQFVAIGIAAQREAERCNELGV